MPDIPDGPALDGPTITIRPYGGPPVCSRCGSFNIDYVPWGSGNCKIVDANVTYTYSRLLGSASVANISCFQYQCSGDRLKKLFAAVDVSENDLMIAETNMQRCITSFVNDGNMKLFFPCALSATLSVLSILPIASEVLSCYYLQANSCTSDDLIDKPGLMNLFIQSRRFKTFIDLAQAPYNGKLTFDSNLTVGYYNQSMMCNSTGNTTNMTYFSTMLATAISENGDNGIVISQSEIQPMIQCLDIRIQDSINHFAQTWNQSTQQWAKSIFFEKDLPSNYLYDFFDLGMLASLSLDFKAAQSSIKQEGFPNFANAWLSAVEAQEIEEAKRLAGVCASVRIQISQEVTLTRTGFEASLEVQNDQMIPLENISVSLRVNVNGNTTFEATSLFVFDDPVLESITSVDGNGTIAANSVGKARWLILPLTEAAPISTTKYDISGILLYNSAGVEYQQNLAPATISVQPDPQLYLSYFFSRVVHSDDPFTANVKEPAIPFHLALLIENRGYGNAVDVKIASSQPKIIENKKGLLVDFKIVGCRLGQYDALSKGLQLNFGMIPGQTNAIGVWDMV